MRGSIVGLMIAKGGSLLDVAQAYWFERFLSVPEDDVRRLDPEVYAWAIPRTQWDGYPNLATCTWPA